MCDQMVPPPHNTRPVNVYRHRRSYIGRVAPTKYDAALSPLNLWRPHVRMSMVSISRLSGISWSCSCLSRLSASLIANAALLWPEPTDACITIRTGTVSVSRVGAVPDVYAGAGAAPDAGADAGAAPHADVASDTGVRVLAAVQAEASAAEGAKVLFVCLQVSMKSIIA